MSTRSRCPHLIDLLALICMTTCGCKILHISGAPGLQQFTNVASKSRIDEYHRQSFQVDKSPTSLRWLLKNRIYSGMALAEVNQVLGEEGTREYNDRWIKTNGGHYRSGDNVYKWSPDSEGTSVYLVFRDGRLVNFDSTHFKEQPIDRF